MEKVKRKEIKNTFLVHRVYLAKKVWKNNSLMLRKRITGKYYTT